MIIPEKILFNRYAKLEFNIKKKDKTNEENSNNKKNIILTSLDIDFDASVTLDMSYNSNKANINIYNLPKSFEDEIERGSTVQITAGYDNGEEPEYGLLFTGVVERLETSKQNATIKTEIQCSDINDIYKDLLFQVTLKGNSKDKSKVNISTIIEKIITNAKISDSKLTLTKPLKLGRDYAYERSKSFNGNLKNILIRLAKDSDSTFSIKQNNVEFLPYDSIDFPEIFCSPTRILNITKSDLGYTITTLFDHRMEASAKLIIKVAGNRFTDSLNSASKDGSANSKKNESIFHDSLDSEVDTYIITKVDHSINPKNSAHISTIEVESQNKVKKQRLNNEKEEKNREEKKTIKLEI